jgi:integrase
LEGSNPANTSKDFSSHASSQTLWWGCPDLNRSRESPSLSENTIFNQRQPDWNDFKDFCTIDLGLAESTSSRHVGRVKQFLKAVDKDYRKITKIEVRDYLKSIKARWSSSKYRNVLASLTRLYWDYLERSAVASSFQFPSKSFKPVTVPSKEDLKKLFQALRSERDRALFLVYATSGLPNSEVVNLEMGDVDFDKRMLIPKKQENKLKHVWVAFYNDEAAQALEKYLASRNAAGLRLFNLTRSHARRILRKASNYAGVKVTPQVLREWFCCEMGSLGVQDRYVDAFCGRTSKSVLARHYTDYSPERLKEIYDKADLKVLS